jgi:4-hydroxy-2-oxoheptanedioate aldolase
LDDRLVRPNPIRAAWSAGKPVINGWLGIACPFTAEIMGQQGYDAMTIDLQHGLIGFESAAGMLQALRASGVGTLIRVPGLDPAAIMRALDAGADGVICPMVDTREQAERLVAAVRYPPRGVRSFGPMRAALAAGADYAEHADDEILCFAMIETAAGCVHADEILSTPGLDIKAGLHTGAPAYAARALGWGFDLVTVSSDVRLLAGAARSSVDAVRGLICASGT